MSQIVRNRDVIVLKKDNVITVRADSALVNGGWAGGQGVTWTDAPFDDFMVTYSDGPFGGFLLWGSDEDADQYIAYTGQQLKYEYALLCVGTWLISTRAYERYTLQSRGAGPLVENTWTVGEKVRFSLRGLFTPQDEWTISGDPRAPNPWFVGQVVQVPRANNNYYLMIHTQM